jgi:hypothetical protein
MGQYTIYDVTAGSAGLQESLVKESVGDLIVNLFPLDTPLQQILEKVPMNNVFTEQPIDTFGSSYIPRAGSFTLSTLFDNSGTSADFASILARPEGWTYTQTTAQYPARLKSVAEIQGLQFAVTDSDRAMSQYGMADRFAYEALKTTESVVNNFEMSFWWSKGTPPAGTDLNSTGGTTQQRVRMTQGLVNWIGKSGLQRSKIGLGQATFTDGHSNEFGTNSAALNTGASAWAYDAAGLSLDQAMFKDQLMGQWYSITGRQAGAVGFCGARVKNLFSQFALTANGAINERTLDAAAKRVVDTVDYYETDFGVVSVNLCRYLNLPSQSISIAQSTGSVTVPGDEVLLFIQPRYFQIGVVRPITLSPLGKTGDFEQGLVRGEMALICRNPQAGSMIVNCLP